VFASVNVGLVVTLLAWGLLADRIGERGVIGIGLSGCAAALVAAGSANRYAVFVALLVVAGAFGGCVQSASGRAVMGWFGPEERGLALGIRQTAVPLGGAVAAVTLPALADGPGLQAAFLALATWTAAAAVAGALFLREGGGDGLDDVGRPLRDTGLWLLCGGSALYLAAQVAIVGFVVIFLHGERGFSVGAAAAVLAVTQVLGGVARIAVGRWSDRLGARVVPLRRIGLALMVALAVTAALVAAPRVVLVPALVVAGALGQAWNGLSYAAAAERAGRARSGAAIGVQQTVLAVGGIVAPVVFAALVGASTWTVGFAAAAACPLLGWIVLAPVSER
jgi:sugar phosphate permease